MKGVVETWHYLVADWCFFSPPFPRIQPDLLFAKDLGECQAHVSNEVSAMAQSPLFLSGNSSLKTQAGIWIV